MRQDQIALQEFKLLVRNTCLGEFAETSIDAIRSITFGNDFVDGGGGLIDRGVGVAASDKGQPLPDRP